MKRPSPRLPAAEPLEEEPAASTESDPAASAVASRREFLTLASGAALGVCGLGAAIGAGRFVLPETTRAPRRFSLGAAADFRMGTVTWLPDHQLFVARAAEGLGVLSSRGTHLGCTVRRTAEGFACPCHGARFDPTGLVVSGPARRALPWYRVWIETDGRLWVDLGEEVPAGPAALTREGEGPA